MAETTQLTRHIESYVDSSSPTHQAASLNAIASLVNTDALTLEALIRELEMYLTTTDNVVRARGILLLAEVMTHIESKPLNSATIHSLVGFFKDRLADWRAVRGALVGCLALIRRKSVVGMVTDSDATTIAQSFLQYMQVQSLGQHYDRKLCFELLDCLLERYFDAVTTLGEDLIYGICEAIDAEKDPDCLKLAFHIVESLAQLNPDSSGLLASFAKDVFDILEPYFPIHFTRWRYSCAKRPVNISDGVNPRRTVVWEPIIRKFEAKLNKWNHRNISMAGRTTLINAVLTALPLFYMSFFRIPSAVIKRLTAIQRRFLWGGNSEGKKIAWISWQQVCAPKEKGGLGIKDIKVSSQKFQTVASMGIFGENGWEWNFSWRRHLFDSELGEATAFIDQTSALSPVADLKDDWTALSFAWRLLWDRLPSKDNLISRQIVLQNVLCPFCQSQVESASHLFFTCYKVMPLWWEFNSWVKEDRVLHSKPMDNFLQHCSLAGSRNSNRRRKIWWIAATRSIWSLRNDMVFNNQSFDISKLMDRTIYLTWSWLRGWEKDFTSAFSSTPLFEPFVIPLLLEKLSSSLHSAKIDSLKYLRVCSSKYGAGRIAKYAGAIWSSLKDTLSTYLGEPDFSFTIAPVDGIGFPENEFVLEALSLLQQLIVQNSSLLVSLIIDDEDVNSIFSTIASYETYDAIPVQEKKKLHAIGRCRELIVGSDEPALQYVFEHETCCTMLHRFSTPLFNAFGSVLAVSADRCPLDPDTYIGVKGLQILAMFGSDVFPIQKSVFENILKKFMSIIVEDFNKTILWEAALKALYQVGSFVQKFHESEKAMSYRNLVVEKIVEILSLDDITLPFSLELEALSNIGMTGMKNMLTILQGLGRAVFSNLSKVHVHRNLRSSDIAVQLLECYSCQLLPWIHENGGSEDFVMQFVVDIWSQAGNCMDFSTLFEEKGLLDAIMKAMKLSVGSCAVESQNLIIQKAYCVLSSHTNFQQLKEVERLPLTPGNYNISLRDEGLISLFASVVIAVFPKTYIPNKRVLMHLFIITLLRGGVVPVAQALGSILNKLVSTSNSAENSSDLTLEEALDVIFNTKISFSSTDNGRSNGNEMVLTDICLGIANDRMLQINAICGLSWIGKGLLLSGHEKIKDIIMIFLECLISGTKSASPLIKDSLENTEEHIQDLLVMKCAADAFHVLMSDSEVCLNRKFHAMIRPLYKQRFSSSVMPILQQIITKSHSSLSRSFLYRAFAHILSDTPMVAILSEAKKLIPVLLDCLSMLTEDIQDKDMLYGLLLVLSGILTEKNGQEAAIENAHIIINCLIKLVDYPHKMLVRETAIQCLVALSELPHARIYPMRTQVLRAISKCLDDSKRAVRHEAVKCRQTCDSFTERKI
ncbi:MMS19 nucleotide excision repair [Glycine max]|nr:MMS19 nucleotide excision repair [Glycine max]